MQLQQALALDTALGVEQLARAFEQQAYALGATGQQAGVAVVQARGAHVEVVAQHAPGAVVDVAAGHVEQQLLADDGAALVIQAGGV